MDNITKQIRNGKNINNILEEMLEKQKVYEYQMVQERFQDGDLEDRLDDVEANYEFNKEKLKYVADLSNLDVKAQQKFLEMLIYIEELPLSRYNVVSTLLTLAALLNKNNKAQDLDNEQLFLASSSLISIPLEDYDIYGKVISREEIISKIINKTSMVDEQLNICFSIFDYCDDFISSKTNEEELALAQNEIVKLIEKYEIKKIEKTI